MRTVTDNFKIDLRTYGRQLDAKVKVNDTDFDSDNLNYIKPSFNTSLFKTIMHQVEIDSKVLMIADTKISITLGVKLNEKSYEYINLGTYYVKTCERQEDTNSYRIMAYTKMKDAMVDYDLSIMEKIPTRDYLIRICQRLGWNTDNIPATFINSTKLIDPILHIGIGYTLRDALDEIATITCSFLLFKDDNFYLKYLTEVDADIDESYLDEDNITIGEKYIINSLVFSRAEESDNIYRKDDTSIAANGLHECRISDCQLLSTNDRSDYINEMFDYLKTLEFYIFDIQSKGILFLEACDMFNLVLNGITYKTILLNDEIDIEDGLKENLYLDEPEETQTEYKYADSTDKKINQTYILVDKQNQVIESVVNNVDEQNQKVAKVTQTVEELNSKISDIADITASKESMSGSVSFEKVNQSEPIRVEIYPTTENISFLYPNSGLFPSDTLFPKVRTLRFTNTTTNEYFDYELPDDLLRCGDIYDEFILDYDAQTCVINKRVGYNADGTTYALETEKTVEYSFPRIELTDGDYTVTLLGYSSGYLFVRLMSQNIYTTQFATKAEVNSEIKQTTEEIGLNVDKKLSNYSTTTEMNSAINVKANEIASTVSTTYATKTELTTAKSEIKQTTNSISSTVSKKVGNDEVISAINQSAETVGIDANKIELSATDILNLLAGNTINLTSKNIIIASNNFNVDKNGNLDCNNATMSNVNIDGGQIILRQEQYALGAFRITYNEDGDGISVGPSCFSMSGGGKSVGMQIGSYTVISCDDFATGARTAIEPSGITTPALTQTSLESAKKNFEKLENGLDIIKATDIYKYNLKSQNDNTKKHIGFVIGDKYKYSKEITSENNDGADLYSMIAVAYKAIQEQQEQIETLQEKDKQKDKLIQNLIQRIETLERRNLNGDN